MPILRYTEEGQDTRKQKMDDLRKRMSNIKELASYKESVEWKNLKALIASFIDTEKNMQKIGVIACDNGGYYDVQEKAVRKETPDRLVSDLRVSVQREAAFQLVIDIVERAEEQADHIQNTLDSIKETFKTAKEQLA